MINQLVRTMTLSIVFLLSSQAKADLFMPATNVPLFGDEAIIELERLFADLIEKSDEVMRDEVATGYLNYIAQQLLAAGDENNEHYQFFIVKSPQLNAFAGPGGYIGINQGLILASQNKSELAAVLAHEIAHVKQQHLIRMLQYHKQQQLPLIASTLAAIALSTVNPLAGGGLLMASVSGIAHNQLYYSRSNELEADFVGLQLLHQAGFDPMSMANTFRNFQQRSRLAGRETPELLMTHPVDERRINQSEQRARQFVKADFITNTLNFKLFQEYIRVKASLSLKKSYDFYQGQLADSNAAPWRYGMALVQLKNGQHQKAIKTLSALLAEHPNSTAPAFYQVSLAQAYEAIGQDEQALALVKQLYEQQPDNMAHLLIYARSLIQLKHFSTAQHLLQEAVYQHPKHAALWETLARVQALNNNKAEAYYSYARQLLLQKKYEQAIGQLNTALDLVGDDQLSHSRFEALRDTIAMRYG